MHCNDFNDSGLLEISQIMVDSALKCNEIYYFLSYWLYAMNMYVLYDAFINTYISNSMIIIIIIIMDIEYNHTNLS